MDISNDSNAQTTCALDTVVDCLECLDRELPLNSDGMCKKFLQCLVDFHETVSNKDSNKDSTKQFIQDQKQFEVLRLCHVLWHHLFGVHLVFFDGEVRLGRLFLRLLHLEMEIVPASSTAASSSYRLKESSCRYSNEQIEQQRFQTPITIQLYSPPQASQETINKFEKDVHERSRQCIHASELAEGYRGHAVVAALVTKIMEDSTRGKWESSFLTNNQAFLTGHLAQFLKEVKEDPTKWYGNFLIIPPKNAQQLSSCINYIQEQYQKNKQVPSCPFLHSFALFLVLVMHCHKDAETVQQFLNDTPRVRSAYKYCTLGLYVILNVL